MNIPVFVGRNAVDMIDYTRAQEMLCAPNVGMVTNRRGEMVGIEVKPYELEGQRGRRQSKRHAIRSKAHYFEKINGAQFGGIHVVGKVKGGGYVKWDDKDTFTAGRFNPDKIQPLRQF